MTAALPHVITPASAPESINENVIVHMYIMKAPRPMKYNSKHQAIISSAVLAQGFNL